MKKQDLFLLLAILFLSAVIGIFLACIQPDGNLAIVEIDGEIIATFPLERDTEYLIQTEKGSNLLVIQNGIARITEADCPDRICVHMGVLSSTNVLTCLPHGVIVYLEEAS